jgi:hypothetical protein
MHLGTFSLLILPAVTCACTTTSWTEVKTAHTTVRTDLGPDDARRAAVLAEQARAALLAVAWPGARPDPDRIELIVFSNHQEFERYFELYSGGFSAKVVLDDYQHLAFLYGAPDHWEKRLGLGEEGTTSVLKETLVEHLSTFFYRRQPRWFSVGLAEFLETVRISEDGRTATVGTINTLARSLYSYYRTFGVADALAWGVSFNPTDEGSVRGLRGLSWLMVQWMFNAHRPEFVRFQRLLITGLDPRKAWNVVFPTLTPAALDEELYEFARYGSERLAKLPIPSETIAIEREQTLSLAEVHSIRAEAALAADQTQDAQAELLAALAQDPGNLAALRRQMALVEPPERLALARQAAVAHPDDGLAWLMLGDALREGGGGSEERVQAYRRAAELAPWDASMLHTLASALAAVGRCREAVATEEHAADLALEKGVSAKRTAYASRLMEIQSTCIEAKALPATSEPAPPRS